MFENQIYLPRNAETSDSSTSENMHGRQYNTALDRFQSALRKGIFSRWKRKILRQQQWLYDLNTLQRHFILHGSCYAGIQVVRISSIIGSEGRVAGFDIDFHPLHDTSCECWVNMTMAHLTRLSLPPVSLIQAVNTYFVRDGHHRISVSRAFGQIAMDAEVITWNASAPFPWQSDALQNKKQVLLEYPDLFA